MNITSDKMFIAAILTTFLIIQQTFSVFFFKKAQYNFDTAIAEKLNSIKC